MDFSFIKMDFSSLTDGGLNTIQFCAIGMTMVFAGLTLIAAYIALLPKMMAFFLTLRKKTRAPKPESADELDHETLLAIATAVHLHQFSSDDKRRITWERHEIWDSSWQRAGRLVAMNRHGQR